MATYRTTANYLQEIENLGVPQIEQFLNCSHSILSNIETISCVGNLADWNI
jgi:hypothetical protein